MMDPHFLFDQSTLNPLFRYYFYQHCHLIKRSPSSSPNIHSLFINLDSLVKTLSIAVPLGDWVSSKILPPVYNNGLNGSPRARNPENVDLIHSKEEYKERRNEKKHSKL